MTVQNENFRNDYDGNDSATVFPVDFRFLTNEQLDVFITESDGTVVDQELDTDYTVTGAGDQSGGDVTMIVAPATGEQLTILREVPVTQLIDYIEHDSFPAESHETGLDKLTMIAQEQAEEMDRTFKLGEPYNANDYDVELIPDTDAFVVWNDTGDGLTSIPFLDIDDYIQVEKLYNSGSVVLDTTVDGIFLPIGAANINEFSVDGTLAGDSDEAIPTEKAVKAFCDAMVLTVKGDSFNTTTVLLNSQEFYVGTGTAGIYTLIAPQSIGIFLDFDVVVDVDSVQAVSNKTFTDCVWASGSISFDEIVLADNKSITFGDGPDAQMFSDGTKLVITDGSQVDTLMEFPVGSGPSLFFNAKETLKVISSGIELTDWTTGETAVIYHFLTNLNIQNDAVGRPILLTVRNAADTDQHTGIVIAPDSYVELYYDGLSAAYTRTGGIYVNNAGSVGSLYKSSSSLYLTNNSNGGDIYIQGAHGAGGISPFLIGDPDGSLDLYYAGDKVLETYAAGGAGGLTIRDTANAYSGRMHIGAADGSLFVVNETDIAFKYDVTLRRAEMFYQDLVRIAAASAGMAIYDSVGQETDIYMSGGHTYIDANYTGGKIRLRGTTTGDVLKDLVMGDPEDSVELFYAGIRAFETSALGCLIYESGGDRFYISMTSNKTYLVSEFIGANLLIRAADDLDVVRTLFDGDPDAGVILYYAGAPKFETTATGIDVNGIVTAEGMTLGDNEFISFGAGPDGRIFSDGTDLKLSRGDGAETFIRMIANGSVHLYYNGDVKMVTHTNGIQCDGDRSIRLDSTQGMVEHYAPDAGWAMGSRFWGSSNSELGTIGMVGSSDVGTYFVIGEDFNLGYILKGIIGGAVELYHDAVLAFKTDISGAVVRDTSGSNPVLFFQSDSPATLATIMAGSGSPEGVHSGTVGSLFLRSDGGASTTLYVKESGTGNTGWVAK